MDGVLFDTERMYQQTWREIAEERGIKLGDGFTTVSYTHLDVYKRQPLCNGVRWKSLYLYD